MAAIPICRIQRSTTYSMKYTDRCSNIQPYLRKRSIREEYWEERKSKKNRRRYYLKNMREVLSIQARNIGNQSHLNKWPLVTGTNCSACGDCGHSSTDVECPVIRYQLNWKIAKKVTKEMATFFQLYLVSQQYHQLLHALCEYLAAKTLHVMIDKVIFYLPWQQNAIIDPHYLLQTQQMM